MLLLGLLLLVVLVVEVVVVVRVTEALAGWYRPRSVGVILYLKTHEVGFMKLNAE